MCRGFFRSILEESSVLDDIGGAEVNRTNQISHYISVIITGYHFQATVKVTVKTVSLPPPRIENR